jgi:hypothetical protein
VPRQLRRNECEGSVTVMAQRNRTATAMKERMADDKERRPPKVQRARPATNFGLSVVKER